MIDNNTAAARRRQREEAALDIIRPILSGNTNAFEGRVEVSNENRNEPRFEQRLYIPLTNIPFEDAVLVYETLKSMAADPGDIEPRKSGGFNDTPTISLLADRFMFLNAAQPPIEGILKGEDDTPLHFVIPRENDSSDRFHAAVARKRKQPVYLELEYPKGWDKHLKDDRQRNAVKSTAKGALLQSKLKLNAAGFMGRKAVMDAAIDLTELKDNEPRNTKKLRKAAQAIVMATVRKHVPHVKIIGKLPSFTLRLPAEKARLFTAMHKNLTEPKWVDGNSTPRFSWERFATAVGVPVQQDTPTMQAPQASSRLHRSQDTSWRGGAR